MRTIFLVLIFVIAGLNVDAQYIKGQVIGGASIQSNILRRFNASNLNHSGTSFSVSLSKAFENDLVGGIRYTRINDYSNYYLGNDEYNIYNRRQSFGL